ncbi:MAG: GDSL-type esterase/lipase family protein [Terriglobia bacterium]
MLLIPVLSVCCFGQANVAVEDLPQLATRMAQLMESTAVAIPGLVRASEALRQNADATVADFRKAPQDTQLLSLFIRQVNAYLALSDSVPRPTPFPAEASRQLAELREDVGRMDRHFDELLLSVAQGLQARAADPSELQRYVEANSKVLPPGNLPRIVFLGDSITDAWRLNEYFTGRDFINRGISGQTTLEMLGRFPSDVTALHPQAVLILAGTNDLGRGAPVAAIENNLATMGDVAKAHSIQPLFASILPVSDYHKDADPQFETTKTHSPDAIRQINKWLLDYCHREGFIYVDYYSPMADTSGYLRSDLSDDGLHPNARGYRVMAPIALEAIGRAIAAAQPSPPGEAPKRRFRMLGK